MGSPASPQTFNKYAYLTGNPLWDVDVLGYGTCAGDAEDCNTEGSDNPKPNPGNALEAAEGMAAWADLNAGEYEIQLQHCKQCIVAAGMAGLPGGSDPGNPREAYNEARYQSQVDNAFNGTNFPFVPSLSQLQPSSGIYPRSLQIPGGSMSFSWYDKIWGLGETGSLGSVEGETLSFDSYDQVALKESHRGASRRP